MEKAPSVEVKAAVERLGRAFAEFKDMNNAATNEEKLKGHIDVVVQEKLDRINKNLSKLQSGLDMLSAKSARPNMGDANAEQSAEIIEHKQNFFHGYMRKGIEANLATLEAKALSTSPNADGGYAVPEEVDRSIDSLMNNTSPMRSIVNVVRVGSANYKKLVATSGASSGWVGEQAARPETATPQFTEITPPLGEIYANPAVTQSMLDDAFFDVESWLAEELAQEFGQQEGLALIQGNGVNKPHGLLQNPTAATPDDVRPFGTLEYLPTGVDGDFAASDPADILVDLIYSLRPKYRGEARFIMNTNLVAAIRKFKDLDGNYLWRPGLAENMPATLLGYPVVEVEDMPDVASDSFSIAFGNFAKGYTITDRTGTRILRDPYSNKPFVHFYTTKRTGGGLINSEAIKLLKFGLS